MKCLNLNELPIAFDADFKKSSGGVQLIQPRKVNVRLVQQVSGTNNYEALVYQDLHNLNTVYILPSLM